MTPAQIAELEKLNAAIAAAPDDARLWGQRATRLAHTDCDLALVIADFKRALQIGGRFKRRPGRWAGPRKGLIYEGNNYCWDEKWNERTQLRGVRASTTAYFALYVETAPDLARWRRARPANWDAYETMKRIAKTSADAPEWESASIEELKVAAVAMAVACRDEVKVELYKRALKLEIAQGRHPNRVEYFVHRARNRETAGFVRQAWWTLAIEAEPDNPNWWAQRGRSVEYYATGRISKASEDDLARAIELAPDDPYFYELRAKLRTRQAGFRRGNRAKVRARARARARGLEEKETVASDYRRATELRIALGQINGAPAALAAQGARMAQNPTRLQKLRAHIFYTLALEAAPDNAHWYLARAQVTSPDWKYFDSTPEATREAAHADYVRALSLDPTIDEARAAIVKYLFLTAPRPTAHDQIEALLDARQSLIDDGIGEALARAIVDEVGAALAD